MWLDVGEKKRKDKKYKNFNTRNKRIFVLLFIVPVLSSTYNYQVILKHQRTDLKIAGQICRSVDSMNLNPSIRLISIRRYCQRYTVYYCSVYKNCENPCSRTLPHLPLVVNRKIVDLSSHPECYAWPLANRADLRSHGGVESNLLSPAPTAVERSSRATGRRVIWRFGFFALNRPFQDSCARPSRNLRCFACRRQSHHVRDQPGKGFLRCDTKKRESTSRSASRRCVLCPSRIGYAATYLHHLASRTLSTAFSALLRRSDYRCFFILLAA